MVNQKLLTAFYVSSFPGAGMKIEYAYPGVAVNGLRTFDGLTLKVSAYPNKRRLRGLLE
jgi:hypothetical protein